MLIKTTQHFLKLIAERGGLTFNAIDFVTIEDESKGRYAVALSLENGGGGSVSTMSKAQLLDPKIHQLYHATKSIDNIMEVSKQKPNVYGGAWHDDNKLYIECTLLTDDIYKALHFATEQGEKAIYDLKQQREIEVPPAVDVETAYKLICHLL